MKVTIAVALAASSFPAATPEVAHYHVSIHSGVILDSEVLGQDITSTTDAAEAVFDGVPDGNYTAMAQAVAADGTKVGPAMQQTFTVAAPDVERSVPTSITVTLS